IALKIDFHRLGWRASAMNDSRECGNLERLNTVTDKRLMDVHFHGHDGTLASSPGYLISKSG
ncbi:MAG: hypothetical protein AAFY26_26105, partial [Cyanobacteria bacterium J06638_22]